MKRISKDHISKYRQRIVFKLDELKRLCLNAGHEDLLLGGTPVKTYKTCGKPNCRCMQEGGEARHGPYLAVQIRHEGKQRNLTLKKSESHYYEMAQHYQSQSENRRKIIELEAQLLEEVDRMISERTIWEKEK